MHACNGTVPPPLSTHPRLLQRRLLLAAPHGLLHGLLPSQHRRSGAAALLQGGAAPWGRAAPSGAVCSPPPPHQGLFSPGNPQLKWGCGHSSPLLSSAPPRCAGPKQTLLRGSNRTRVRSSRGGARPKRFGSAPRAANGCSRWAQRRAGAAVGQRALRGSRGGAALCPHRSWPALLPGLQRQLHHSPTPPSPPPQPHPPPPVPPP